MFHAAPRTGRRHRCTEQRHFAQLLRVTNSPEGCFPPAAGRWPAPGRPLGDAFVDLLLHQRVSTQPGQMALQVMPLRAVSRPRFGQPTTACLAAT